MKPFELKICWVAITLAIVSLVHVLFDQYVWTTPWIVKNNIFLWIARAVEFSFYFSGFIFMFLLACDNARKPEERRRGIR